MWVKIMVIVTDLNGIQGSRNSIYFEEMLELESKKKHKYIKFFVGFCNR